MQAAARSTHPCRPARSDRSRARRNRLPPSSLSSAPPGARCARPLRVGATIARAVAGAAPHRRGGTVSWKAAGAAPLGPAAVQCPQHSLLMATDRAHRSGPPASACELPPRRAAGSLRPTRPLVSRRARPHASPPGFGHLRRPISTINGADAPVQLTQAISNPHRRRMSMSAVHREWRHSLQMMRAPGCVPHVRRLHRMRPEGIEPSACGLKDRCSLAPRREPLTTELRALDGTPTSRHPERRSLV